MLLGDKFRLLLDVEPQRPGEDEGTAALRLLERVVTTYPRAFQLLLGDALYATAPFLNFLLAHGKHALVVFKDARRELYQDVAGLLESVPPQRGQYRGRDCRWWDLHGLLSWPDVKAPLRVIRSQETYTIRRQATQQLTTETADWVWATTLGADQAPTSLLVRLGHQRWDIENYGFNELVNGWQADHVYRHEANAMEAFLLTVMLAYNIFHAFLARNLKPQIRHGKTEIFWARLIAAELYLPAGLATGLQRSP